MKDSREKLNEIKKLYDGYNEFENTSNVSNYIRYRTAEKSFEEAIDFFKKNIDRIIVPTFIKLSKNNNQTKLLENNFLRDAHFPFKTNNVILDDTLRQNLDIVL